MYTVLSLLRFLVCKSNICTLSFRVVVEGPQNVEFLKVVPLVSYQAGNKFEEATPAQTLSHKAVEGGGYLWKKLFL